ncbi:hypothetical protein DFR24_0447 [Panacagrimonas perspica]|uniref:Uncharacterized protein n=1 Tax=Panacagrimonas perspica TaxID=381431 RepID=A0A4R7PBU9_9GAMM|nr:hypothetical protein [Panacagrimonas perspica]TDU31089.1 hypothetical protein DFR24_0447 [Panacagrimonas perspica]THD01772.1 hypothetical protein B1810_17330 [Panacagrimonas perspica]
MRNGARATYAGVKHFFSFGGTNKRVDKGNAVLHGNQSAAKKAEVISQLFLAMAIRSSPIGLAGNTLSSIKAGRRKYKELKNMLPQLTQTLTALGVSPGGVQQILQAIRGGSALNLSNHDEQIIAGDFDTLANAAVAQGVSPDVIRSILVDVRHELGTGTIAF